MKKIGIVFSVLLLSAFLTACSNPEGADVDISAEPAQTAGAANDAETSEGIPETILYEEKGIIIKAISLSAG